MKRKENSNTRKNMKKYKETKQKIRAEVETMKEYRS